MLKVIYAVVPAFLLCFVGAAHGADTPAAAPANPCSQVSAPADATEAVKALYAQIAEQCAALQLRQVDNQLSNLSATQIAQALAGFSAIPGPSGKINNPENANHIGEWLAKRNAIDAGKRLGKQLYGSKREGKYIVITDPALVLGRPMLLATVQHLSAFQAAIDSSKDEGANVLAAVKRPFREPESTGERIGFAAGLALVPPLVTAVHDFATIFRSETALRAIAISGDAGWVVVGIGACMKAGGPQLVMPMYASGRNELADAYTKIQRSARTGNDVLAQLAQAEATLIKGGDKTKEDLAKVQTAKAKLQNSLDAFGSYDKALNVVPAGGTKSQFDKLIETAAIFNDPSAGFLIVQLPGLGATSGTRSRFIGSDKLEFQSTALANYLLISKDGILVDAAVEAIGRASSMTAEEADSALVTLSRSTACE